SRQASDGKGQGIRPTFDLVVDAQWLEILKRFRERSKRWNHIVTSAHLKAFHFALSCIQNQIAKMIAQLILVLLHIGKRTVKPLLFAGEQHEANRSPRPFARALDGVCRTESRRRS